MGGLGETGKGMKKYKLAVIKKSHRDVWSTAWGIQSISVDGLSVAVPDGAKTTRRGGGHFLNYINA